MDRRTALGTLGSIGGVGLAGCFATDGGDTGGSGSGDGGGASTGGEGQGGADDSATTSGSSPGPAPSLTTPAFDDGDPIPTRYTCDGENGSPELSITGVSEAVASLALVVDDPDAPGQTYTHWLLWGLPTTTETIPEGVPPGETVERLGGASQGTNDAGVVGYSGPCPPPAHDAHTYRFRLLALAEPIDLDPGTDRTAFDGALQGVESVETVLRGTYDR